MHNSGVAVILLSVRQHLICSLHDCHPGMVALKTLTRSYVWWPRIDSDLEGEMIWFQFLTRKSCSFSGTYYY